MINSIKLRNWKSHRESSFQFQPGTNVLVGNMGSGKSSVLQAISFGLFGTFSELKSRESKISEIISRGSKQDVSELNLSITSPKDKLLKIKRKIDANNGTEGVVRDSEGALISGPQTTQVNEFVKAELGIDEDVFLRTIYAVQNNIDMILKMSPKQRKKKIDELMGLNKFDTARDNCVTLRNRVVRRRKDAEKFLDNFGIEDLNKQMQDMEQQIENLKSKKLEIGSELKEKKEKRGNVKSELEKSKDMLEEMNKLQERRNGLLKQLNNISEKLGDKKLDKSKEEIETQLSEIKGKIAEHQKEKTTISQKVEEYKKNLASKDKQVALAESKVSDLKEKLSKIDEINKELSEMKVTDLNQEILDVRGELEDKKDERKVNQLELKNFRERLQKLSESDTNCPVCDSELPSQKKEKLISETKARISQLIYKNTELAEVVSKFEKRYNELKDIIDRNRRYLDELSNEEEIRSEYFTNCSEIKKKKRQISELRGQIKQKSGRVDKLEKVIESLSSKMNELNDSKYLYELKEQRQGLKKEISAIEQEMSKVKISKQDVKQKEHQFQRLLESIQELRTTLSNFEDLLTEKTKRLAELTNQKEKFGKVKQKIKNYEERVRFLNKFQSALEATQLALRDELILAVNEVMSQIWIEIYPYEKWSGIRLSSNNNDYELQIKESEGDWVSVVGLASGGERMLASLAVRIAFARVLAPSLSLLILDEPTNNLDEKAIETFIDVVQNKVADFLDQIFIVSHEEKLAENADNIIRLEL